MIIINMFLFILIIAIIIIIICLLCYNLGTRYVVLENESGRQLHYLGVMHAGTAEYFKQLQEILDCFHGVILFEGIRDGDGLEPVLKTYKLISELLDIEFQGNAVQYHSDWIISDITMRELDGKINMQEITNQDALIEKWIDEKNKMADTSFSKWWWKKQIEIVSLLNLIFPFDPLVTERNKKPIIDAEKFLNNGVDVLIFYGDAHAGIVEHFKKAGFQEKLKRYFKVF